MTRKASTLCRRQLQHSVVHSGKSEAKVRIINDCTRGITLLKLTTDGHKALRGLSATAELLVATWYYASAAYAIMWCPSVYLSVCLARSYILSKWINISSKFFSRFYFLSVPNSMAIFWWEPRNGGVECRWGRQKSRFWAGIWLHCVLWSVPAANAIHLAVTDHGEFITLVAGKWWSLLMAGNNDEVYDKKPQRYVEDNVTQW